MEAAPIVRAERVLRRQGCLPWSKEQETTQRGRQSPAKPERVFAVILQDTSHCYDPLHYIMTQKAFTYDEVLKHNLPDDCWLIINGGVYDVSSYINEHPGGPIVLQTRGGCVATNAFRDANHSNQAINVVMPKYRIGRIDQSSLPMPEQLQRQSKSGNILGIAAVIILVLVLVYHFASK